MGQKRIKLSAMRRFIGNSLRESVTTYPQARSWAQADVTELLRLKDELKAQGKPTTFTALLVKATAIALGESPMLNSYLDGNEIVVCDEVNVGFAIQGERGLYVPVIRDVQDKNAAQVSEDMRALAEKIRNGTIIPDDMAGGTVTVSSDGTGRTEFIAPILNQAQCLLIGAGRTKKCPVVLPDGSIGVRDMIWLVFVMNHVITDGIHISRFTDRLCEILEAPREYLAY